MGGGGGPLHLTALKSTQTNVAHLSSSQPLTQCPFCIFFILKSFYVMGRGRPMSLRVLTLPPPASHHVISVRPAKRLRKQPPAEPRVSPNFCQYATASGLHTAETSRGSCTVYAWPARPRSASLATCAFTAAFKSAVTTEISSAFPGSSRATASSKANG